MNNVNSSDIRRKPCVVWDEQHPVFLCRDFKNMSVSTRSNVVVKFKLGINCLKSGRDVAKCEKQSYCRAPDCTIKYNSLLHENVVANHTIDTNVCNNICMPVATALVSNTEVSCLLDTGSTSIFISDKLATQLNLDATASHVNLKTLNSSTSKDTNVVNVSVDSLDHKFHIDMKNVYVVDSIPTKPFNIDINSYSHLKDIDIYYYFGRS